MFLFLPQPTRATTFTHALIQGDTGTEVTTLQQILFDQGFLHATPTGYFGPLTVKAVAAFQTAHGIDALGGVGPLTRAVLDSLSASSTTPTSTPVSATTTSCSAPVVITRALDIGATGSDVTALQNFLVAKSYLNTTPTGYFGNLTHAAVAAFQTAQGFDPVGGVGPLTRAKIASLSSVCTNATTLPNNSGAITTTTSTTTTATTTAPFYYGGGGGGGGGAGGGGSSGDTTAPSVPTNLAAVVASSTEIDLSWTASTDNVAVANYQVFRGGVLIASPATTTYADTGLTPGTSYSYTVLAVDTSSNASAQTSPVATSTIALAVISNISSGTPTTTAATITWTTDQNSNSQVVYGLTTGYGLASSTASLVTSHSIIVSGLVASTTYQYEVVSTNGGGSTSTSTNQTFTTASSGGSGNTSNFTWQQLQVGDGGFIDGMSIAPDDTMVVRTDTYGAYLWDGSQWQQLVNANSMPASFVVHAQFYNDGVYEIQIAPSNSSTIYMVYPIYQANTYPPLSGVYKSTNKGASWTQTSFTPIENQASLAANGPYRMWGPKMAINPTNPNNVYVGTGAQGLFVTTDGGTTWSSVGGVPVATSTGGNYPGITGILFDPANTSVIYAASYGKGIYQTTNGGTSWSQINSGSGPTSVMRAAISPSGTNGTYYAIDQSNNLWAYNGTWTEVLPANPGQGINIQAVTVDPFNSNHVVATLYNGNLDESFDDGGSWSGWSKSPNYVVNGLPWQTDSYDINFDQVISDKLYINGDRSFWTTTLSGNITTNTTPTWAEQGLGIEQLVANEIIVPPVASSTPLLASWDTPVLAPNFTSYPSTVYPSNVLAAGWSIDYASSNPNFIAVLADGSYAGGPQASSYSTNDGQTWTAFPTTPYSTFGGIIAASSPSNIIFGSSGVQPYYTLDGGNTWNSVTLPGVSSWSSFTGALSDSRLITADRVNANTFYLDFGGTGIFKTTNGGVSWTEVNSNTAYAYGGTAQLRATPGQAGDLWLSSGAGGNAGSQGNAAGNNSYLLHSTNGGTTWTTLNINEPYAVGFGAPAPGQSYPAVYTVGWLTATSTTSVTIGTGAQTFTVQTGLGYQAGNTIIMGDTFNGANTMTGTVTSYNSSTGALVVNVTSVTGSGTPGNWTIDVFGVWESDNQGSTWKQLGPWPFNSLDGIKTISGDPNIYGKVYVGFGGSGYAYYSSDGPRLRTVAFSPSSGTEVLGSITTLGLSEPVTVSGGTPTLSLNDGGTATYASGSGSSALAFSYTVQSGQATSSLAATAVNLNGATIQDSAGNNASLSLSGIVQSGPTISGAAPVISSIASSPAPTTATITWTTDENATSQVVFGTTTAYGTASSSASLVTSHSINLTGLATSTTYHFAVVSTNGAGQTSTSTDQTLTVPGGVASYSFEVATSTNPSGTTGTIAGLNLGNGSVYCILGIGVQNAPTISGVTVNGSSLSAVDTNTAGGDTIWSGPCTVTGSDSVVVTTATSMNSGDLDLIAWTAQNLVSNTPVSHNNAISGSISSAASVGNFVFALNFNNFNFNSSAQPPSGSRTATGANGGALVGADWTASAGGISGGNFTATASGFSYLVMAVWH